MLLGSEITMGRGGLTATNLYVNGAFNYMDQVGDARSAVKHLQELTAGPDRPAAVLWRDKFGIFHGQALLTYGGFQMGANGGTLDTGAPKATQLAADTLGINLGHPEALAIVDGDQVFGTVVNDVVPVHENGAQWSGPQQP